VGSAVLSPVTSTFGSVLSPVAGAAVSNDTAGMVESLVSARRLEVSPPQASDDASNTMHQLEREWRGAGRAAYDGAPWCLHRGIESNLALRKMAAAGHVGLLPARVWHPSGLRGVRRSRYRVRSATRHCHGDPPRTGASAQLLAGIVGHPRSERIA